MWGYGAFLCPLSFLIIRVPCFENAEGKKNPGQESCKDPEIDAMASEMNSPFNTSSG